MDGVKYLVMVVADSNNNKYYKMIPKGDGTWEAQYGRVGNAPATQVYPMSKFNSKYNEKIRKGYVDQTDLIQDAIVEHKPAGEKQYKKIENAVIAEIVDKLQKMAKEEINKNYTVSSTAVTMAMVDDAQDIINHLVTLKRTSAFNENLLRLFSVIPRKMSKVANYLAESPDDFDSIIKREQDLLDVMRGQVVVPKKDDDISDESVNEGQTILESYGLVFEECDENDIRIIKKALAESAGKFSRAWRVTNLETQRKYDEFVKNNNIKDTKLLFHGSRNENWWSIIKTGLKLRPTNVVITGKMFGLGTYFAPKAQKSIGYTSLSGSYWAHGGSNVAYMALMDVAYGKPYDVYSFESAFHSLTYEALQKRCPNANCLHAHAGSMLRNDEIVIYKEEQCTIHYLVEIKN